jgi:23S rRNA pseudouridine955/2504/2580 synthase
MFLHACKIRFPHPACGEPLALEAPLPPALAAFLERLAKEEKQDYGQTI